MNVHHLWFVYFWPSLQGNGPEDLIAFIIIGGGLTWIGRWCVREWRAHKARMVELHHETRAHAEELHKRLHKRLDHNAARVDALQITLDAAVPAKPANPPKPVKRAPRKKAT